MCSDALPGVINLIEPADDRRGRTSAGARETVQRLKLSPGEALLDLGRAPATWAGKRLDSSRISAW